MTSSNAKSLRSRPKFALHPLIHTVLRFVQAQNVEKKKAEPRTPHFLSLNQYIVAWSKKTKCGVCYLQFPKNKGKAISDPADFRLALEREERIELPTFFLEGRCSTN